MKTKLKWEQVMEDHYTRLEDDDLNGWEKPPTIYEPKDNQ